MTLQLVEGQDFSANYTLLRRVSQREGVENWLALDKQLNERVLLKILHERLSDDQFREVEHGIDRTRGLVHPNIARVYSIDREQSHDFIASRWVRDGRNFEPDDRPFADQWTLVSQLFDAVGFAHSLGLAHGRIHPGNLLIDDQGTLYVTDFGLPAILQNDRRYRDWLSPQVRDGASPDASDDVWSVGQLLHVLLTGDTWRGEDSFESTSPIPEEVRLLVAGMLRREAWERPGLADAREIIGRFATGETDELTRHVTEFRRADGAAPSRRPMSTTHRLPRERRVVPAPLAFAGLALLVAVAVGVVFVLPEGEPAPYSPTPAAAEPATRAPAAAAEPAETAQQPELTPLELARQKQLEEEGSAVASALLRLQVELEDAGVQIWAPERYAEVTAITNEADTAYRDDAFEQALALYKQGVAVLEELKASMDTVKAENRATGEQALAAGDAEAAIRAYTIVTAIDPDDADAEHQLTRAENLEEVLGLMEEGRFLESEGKLAAAREQFEAARELDPDWQPAREALDRVAARIATRRFNDAMSKGMTALADARFDAARSAFEEAQTILPDSPEPADGLEQVKIAVRRQRIDEHREAAQQYARQEEWSKVIEEYEAILDLDETLVFASNGLNRARSRLALDRRLERYLAQPTLLASDEELARAREALVEATRVDQAGPELEEQIDRLSHYISVARIPVSVELRSDNKTDVTVYQVGNLGRIESESLKLLPGSYTIVGKRRGYRDVEYELNLIGGKPVEPVYIACTEKI